MRTAQQGDQVQVHYVKRLQNGSVCSSREPLELTVGIDHPRLPGLGAALVGLTPGQATMLTIPPEQAYGLSDPARVRRWFRRRFPEHAALEPGKRVRFTDDRGRCRRVRILEVNAEVVVVDVNHRWAGQRLELEVKLVAIRDPDACPAAPAPKQEQSTSPVKAATGRSRQRPRRPRAVAFDVDAASLASLREALPGWEIVAIAGVSAASLTRTWDPGAADLLVVGVRNNATETLGLCRLLACCTPHAKEARQEMMEALGPRENRRSPAREVGAPLLFLVSPGQQTLAGAALEAGACSCLVLPINAEEVASMLARARAGNPPGRHTGGLDQAPEEDPWQDEGGEG